MPSGNCRGGAGQCVDAIRKGHPCDEWTQEMLDKFCSIWDEWHLNDMRPYCKHQKELGWNKLAVTPVTLYHYRLNSKPSAAGIHEEKLVEDALRWHDRSPER